MRIQNGTSTASTARPQHVAIILHDVNNRRGAGSLSGERHSFENNIFGKNHIFTFVVILHLIDQTGIPPLKFNCNFITFCGFIEVLISGGPGAEFPTHC